MVYRSFVNAVSVDVICMDLALSQGPAAILAAHQSGSMDDIVESLNDSGVFLEDGFDTTSVKYISYPLNKIWGQRKMKPPPSDASHWKSILDVIHGERDTCVYRSSCH